MLIFCLVLIQYGTDTSVHLCVIQYPPWQLQDLCCTFHVLQPVQNLPSMAPTLAGLGSALTCHLSGLHHTQYPFQPLQDLCCMQHRFQIGWCRCHIQYAGGRERRGSMSLIWPMNWPHDTHLACWARWVLMPLLWKIKHCSAGQCLVAEAF